METRPSCFSSTSANVWLAATGFQWACKQINSAWFIHRFDINWRMFPPESCLVLFALLCYCCYCFPHVTRTIFLGDLFLFLSWWTEFLLGRRRMNKVWWNFNCFHNFCEDRTLSGNARMRACACTFSYVYSLSQLSAIHGLFISAST